MDSQDKKEFDKNGIKNDTFFKVKENNVKCINKSSIDQKLRGGR